MGQQHACAYGVAFDSSANTFSIVAYAPPVGTPCSPAGAVSGGDVKRYDVNTWKVPVGPGVKLAGGSASLVLFYPPDPTTLLSNSACIPGGGCTYAFAQAPMAITLATDDGSASGVVHVSAAGQVDIQ